MKTIILNCFIVIVFISNAIGQYSSKCDKLDSLMITYMGSSVALGMWEPQNHGYAYFYTNLLKQRDSLKQGAAWHTSNISIGGNTTINLLNRWSTDLLPLCSKYVVYGLSLGNEGIHGGGQPVFDQFRNNMLKLIKQARDSGMEPVVVNCYTRNDYNSSDYQYVKKMNMLIHSWNVASVNVLGAVDDGTGKWVLGYYIDGMHPNTNGHHEFCYTIVPSLFDALKAGKQQPRKMYGTYLTIDPAKQQQLEFVPDAIVHPFTFSFDIKTAATGSIAGFTTDSGYCYLQIDNQTGFLKYTSLKNAGITGSVLINDNQWHKISFTHYYARGMTFLYVDSILQGSISEKIISNKFHLSNKNAPVADYRNWMFYRSAMNDIEIKALVNDSLLKSSLELYAPLDGQGLISTDKLVNMAQSTVLPQFVINNSTGEINNKKLFRIFPNPVDNFLNIEGTSVTSIAITDITGRLLMERSFSDQSSHNCVNLQDLEQGIYTVRLICKNNENNNFIIIKQ